MKFLRFSFVMLALIISCSMMAQSQKELSQLMRERNEYYFTLNVNDPHEIQAINELCSVDGFKGTTVVCYANQQQYDRLLKAGYQPNLQTPPSMLEEAVMWDGRATYEWDSYPTYSQYESMMQAYPASAIDGRICTYMELGTLSSNRKIMGVRINNGDTIGKPKFLYSSTIHGDETTGMILMLRLIDELCTSTDSRIENLVNSLDIFIFPDANPDGTYYGGNNSVTGSRRANANGVDMNRNYPDPHSSQHPDGNVWQSETEWFMKLAQDYPFVMAANFHGGAEVMNYPWDNTSTRHADDAWWQYISNEYVANTRAVYSGYMTDTYSSGITNGADWYMIGGGRQDYMNGYCQCREITIECSTTKTLAASQLNNYWNYNHTALLAYMEQCLNGIHGVVRDAITNQIIEGATVTVQNHDDEYSIVSTHEDGYFHRPIKGGTWTLKITKEGYCNETVAVTVADDQWEDVDVYLYPEGDCPVVMNCYEQTIPSTNGSYVMGYLNGSTLVMPTHNNGTANTTSVTVTPNDLGFSVEEEGLPGLYTLTAYGSNGQYFISYNNRYLTRSSSYGGNSSLSWSTNQSTNNRWHIDSNGIYVSASSGGMGGGSTTNYYLYYNNGSFALSTTQQNNVHFYVAGDCPTPTFTITATANPTEGGSVSGVGTFEQGETCTLTATAAEGYQFVNWTEGEEEVSTEASISFEVTADRELVANFELIPMPTFTITATPNPTEGGTVEGTGTFDQGATCTLTATPAEGYQFVNWTEGEEEVSTEAEYSFTVTADRELVANFEEVISTTTQTVTLHTGWNWWSTYVEIDLEQLETALGDNGVNIMAQNGYVINETDGWEGSLTTIQNEKMYRIYVSDETTVTLTGILASPTNHTIYLNTGWNWVGFISATALDLNTALAGFNASTGDIIKGTVGTGFAEYEEGFGWYGSLKKLQPGMGYMIYSSKSTDFQYPN